MDFEGAKMEQFLFGMVCGIVLCFIGFLILARSTRTATVKEEDPADWWKQGCKEEDEEEEEEEFR